MKTGLLTILSLIALNVQAGEWRQDYVDFYEVPSHKGQLKRICYSEPAPGGGLSRGCLSSLRVEELRVGELELGRKVCDFKVDEYIEKKRDLIDSFNLVVSPKVEVEKLEGFDGTYLRYRCSLRVEGSQEQSLLSLKEKRFGNFKRKEKKKAKELCDQKILEFSPKSLYVKGDVIKTGSIFKRRYKCQINLVEGHSPL